MIKKCLLVLIAAGVISMAAPFVMAQDNAPPPPDQQSAPPPANNGGQMRRGPVDPARRTQALTKKLNLTADQQTKVQSIFEAERSQMEATRQDSSMSPQDRHAKMMDMRKSSDSQIRAILDPNQQKQWDDMMAQHQQMMQNHGAPGSGSDQQTPPPPPPQ